MKYFVEPYSLEDTAGLLAGTLYNDIIMTPQVNEYCRLQQCIWLVMRIAPMSLAPL